MGSAESLCIGGFVWLFLLTKFSKDFVAWPHFCVSLSKLKMVSSCRFGLLNLISCERELLRSSVKNSFLSAHCIYKSTMRIHRGYLCNETMGIGKMKWGIPLQVTLDSTGKLHLLVYRIVCFLFYLFKVDKAMYKTEKMACRDRGGDEEGSPKLNKTNNCLFPSLLNLLKKSVQADAFFLLLARNSSFNQLVLLSAFFATVLLKMQTQIFAEVASVLYFLVVCCEKLIHWGLWKKKSKLSM